MIFELLNSLSVVETLRDSAQYKCTTDIDIGIIIRPRCCKLVGAAVLPCSKRLRLTRAQKYGYTNSHRKCCPRLQTHCWQFTNSVVGCQPQIRRGLGKVRRTDPDILTTELRHQRKWKSLWNSKQSLRRVQKIVNVGYTFAAPCVDISIAIAELNRNVA